MRAVPLRAPKLPSLRRLAAELAFLVVVGALMAALAPYGSEETPAGLRLVYWEICIIGGGVFGIGIDAALGRRLPGFWRRLAVDSLLMTPPTAALVIATVGVLLHQRFDWTRGLNLLWQVWIVGAAIMAVRQLAWRAPERRVETRTVVEPPLPEAEAVFRRRLSAKRRHARLLAVEAHDHYLRVHTDAGVELVTLRFADALEELAAAHGFRTHRSWWVAAAAVEDVRWKRGVGEARLAGDVLAPVSRTYAPALKAAGWF